ncbi:MAG: FKBP-type peptidyl-prolyl cis-trans isomerase [Pseudomonadota bacterium]|nr:FKBP-type peptidyl-prolyl cis-trans isomerase [Pseudomonadota bacterium]
MSRFLRSTAAILTAGSLAVMAAGCKPGDDADTATKAGAEAANDDGTLKIAGLATEKQQVSYMIGLDLAKSLEPVKDEVDLDTLNKALRTALDGKDTLMTDEQATQVRQAFGQRVQAKQMAEAEAKAKKNLDEEAKFLAENVKKPNVQTTSSGLQYQVLTEGKGVKPAASDMVRVHYKGTLLDGSTFDSSYERNEPVVFPLSQVVPGWQEGIAMMPVGSKYMFWIPSKLGYGEQGTPGGPIGPNATLVFEVELLEIVEAPAS